MTESGMEIRENHVHVRTPCELEIADDCQSWEKPGPLMMVLAGTWGWVCPPCAAMANPQLEAGRREAETLEMEYEE